MLLAKGGIKSDLVEEFGSARILKLRPLYTDRTSKRGQCCAQDSREEWVLIRFKGRVWHLRI
jgi:hypothetical protein